MNNTSVYGAAPTEYSRTADANGVPVSFHDPIARGNLGLYSLPKNAAAPRAATAMNNNANVYGAPTDQYSRAADATGGVPVSFRDSTPRDDSLPAGDHRYTSGWMKRHMEHYRRVCVHARELLPQVRGRVRLETEQDLVELMYGDVDDFGKIVDQSPVDGSTCGTDDGDAVMEELFMFASGDVVSVRVSANSWGCLHWKDEFKR